MKAPRVVLYVAATAAVVLAANYIAASAGHPTSLWAMQNLGLMP